MTDESLEARVDALENDLNHEKIRRDKLEEQISELKSKLETRTADLRVELGELEEQQEGAVSASGVGALRERVSQIETIVAAFGELAAEEESSRLTRARDLYVRMIRRAENQEGTDDNQRYQCTFKEAIGKLREAGHADVNAWVQIDRLDVDHLPGMVKTTNDAGTKVIRVDVGSVPQDIVNIAVDGNASPQAINNVVDGSLPGTGSEHARGETAHNAD